MSEAKNKITRTNFIIVAAVTLLIGVATYIIIATRAAGFFAATEPELGALASNAQVVNDVNASGGKAVQFTAPATPPPSPPQSGTSSCPLPKYPSPSCTGVAGGDDANFTTTTSSHYEVTTAGTVIDKWHIKGDLKILADNVVIKNSLIDGTVNNQGSGENYYSFTIADSTVGPKTGCVGSPGVGEAKYTATRVQVRNHDDGFRLSGTGNGTVQDSYFHACYLPPSQAPPDGSHSDGVQAVCGETCAGFQLLHNTLDLSDVPATFPLNLMDAHLTNVVANDNLLLGGNNYLISALWRSGSHWIFHNNRLVKDTWGHDNNLNFAVSGEGTCAHQDWQGNTVVAIDNKTNYTITATTSNVGCIE